MAKARAIVKRRRAVRNIRKITRTMQLIATARYQAAFNRANRAKPYTHHLREMVDHLAGNCEGLEHPLLHVNDESKRSVVLALTSNRGLCGGYNAAVLKETMEVLEKREKLGEQVDLMVAGKKGISYFRFLGYDMAGEFTVFEDRPDFLEVEPIATAFINAYTRRDIDAVYVTYTRFESAARQQVETIPLLPLEPLDKTPESEADERAEELVPRMPVQFDFTPAPEKILASLLPETVKVRLFQCFVDAAVSEQVARMVAMKSATDAGDDMIKTLSQQYNRARQSAITLELLDIVGGAEAMG